MHMSLSFGAARVEESQHTEVLIHAVGKSPFCVKLSGAAIFWAKRVLFKVIFSPVPVYFKERRHRRRSGARERAKYYNHVSFYA